MRRRLAQLFVVLAVAAASAARGDDDAQASLLGYWECDAGDCPDEAVEFAERDGERVYSSWLHDRPAASDGRWTLDGANLDIQCCEGLEYHYTVVSLDEHRLELREADTVGAVVMIRRPGVGAAVDSP